MPTDSTVTETPLDHGPAEPWLTCVAPLALFLVAGTLEPTPSGGLLASLGIPYAAYPLIYAVRIAATLALLAWVWPHVRAWVGRPTWWPPLLGVLLVVPWVVLAKLQHDAGWTFGAGERAGYNPFLPDHLGPDSPWAWAFLALRGLGLVVIVPIIEELFVRGFLMRYVIKEQFWEVPFGMLTAASAAACTAYAVASHPGEAIAAAGWFAVVSGIAAATRKPIDCILCHAATNLALGAYVLAAGEWWLV
jgi:CAAX prenyl protease-like protein